MVKFDDTVSEIATVVKVVDSHLCGSHSGKGCTFLMLKGSSLRLICSGYRVKYWIPSGFPLIISLLLDYHVKQHTKLCITASFLFKFDRQTSVVLDGFKRIITSSYSLTSVRDFVLQL